MLAVILTAGLAACSSTVAGSGVTASGTTAPPSGTAASAAPSAAASPAAVPAGLEKFYGQRLNWGSCAKFATSADTKFYKSASLQCADLTVPLAYDNPTGPSITVQVLRKPATDQAQRIGSVVINPGGPGGSGVEYAAYLGAYGVAVEVNKRFDLVASTRAVSGSPSR